MGRRVRSAGKKLVIFGTGDFARTAAVYFSKDSPTRVSAFTVHRAYLKQKRLLGLPVVPFERIRQLYPPNRYALFVAIGYRQLNRARAKVYEDCKRLGYELVSYVSSKAARWDGTRIGDNCFILENNVLQPFVKIGNNVILWSGNHVGHDSVIGDHCFIASHAVISGNVRIGPYCFIGVNATLRDGITVAPECVIGAGALILKDTRPQQVFASAGTPPAGIPAHRLKEFQ